MLKRLRVQNFRLLRDVDIEFEKDAPTVFIGPNGSGKSTVLEVLDFLARCGNDSLHSAAVAHGGINGFRTIGSDGAITIDTTWQFEDRGSKSHTRPWALQWLVSFIAAPNGGVIVQREELKDLASGQPRPLVFTNDGGKRFVAAEDGTGKHSPITSNNELAFEAFLDETRFEGLFCLRGLLMNITVVGAISTAPAWARAEHTSASPRDSLVIEPKELLDRQGLGLANVLFGLFNEHGEAWSILERAFRAEFPFVRRIVFPPDVGGSRITFAFEDARFKGRKLLASEMSDGMITYLCLLASVLHPRQRGILGLDEPDANLHPSALRRLIGLAHDGNTFRRVAIVTHSNALLDELRDPAKSIRIVESTESGARIRKLDAEALAAWRKDYTVSDMRKTGLLDAVNSSYGSEE